MKNILCNKIVTFIKQPYPYYYSLDKLLKLSLAIMLIIFIFLFLFRPFNININELRYNYNLTCIIYGFVAGLSFFVTLLTINICFHTTFCNEDNWTIAKELFVLILLLYVIGNSNFLIRSIINTNPYNFKLTYYFEEQLHTYLVGIIPIGIFTTVNYHYLNISNKNNASKSDNLIKTNNLISTPHPSSIVTITSQSIYESITIDINSIIYIRSDGNYINIHLFENGSTNKKQIRNTLKNIERQLSVHSNIVKTHRSHLVNTIHIKSIKGNAQGYAISLKNCDYIIPVSRHNICQFDKVINNSSH